MLLLGVQKTSPLHLAVRAAVIEVTSLVFQACEPWKEAKPTAGGFVVQMPGNASCNFSRGPSDFGKLPGSVCWGNTHTLRSESFGIYMASGYGLPPNQDLEAVIRATSEEVKSGVRDSGAIIVAEEQRTIDGAVWSAITMEGGEAKNRVRTVHLATARREGAYALAVTGPAGAWPTQGAERFLASFRFQGRPGDFKDSQRK